MSINERVKEVRMSNSLTLKQFSSRIGISDAAVSQIENGKTGISDQSIRSICREFSINEEWLRTGEGEMKAENSTAIEISEAVRRVLSDKPASFQSALITVLMRFEEEGNQWHVMEEIFDRVREELERRRSENAKKP